MLGLGLNFGSAAHMGGPVSLLLDTYTGAAAAYSLRKLKSDYTGKVLQVRRASDHVEVDVGFDSNGLLSLDSPVTNVTEESTGITQGSSTNAAKLGEFCGEARRDGGDTSYATVDSMTEAAHVEVVTWYDQSGNANNATQVAASNQPRIYDRSSGLIVENGKPVLHFYQMDHLGLSSLSSLTAGEVFYTIRSKNDPIVGGNGAFMRLGGGPPGFYPYSGGTYGYIFGSFGNTTRHYTALPASVTSQLNIYNQSSISGEWRAALNGSDFYTTTSNTVAFPTSPRIGYDQDAYRTNYHLAELVLLDSKQSTANRAGIETNINTFYSIY